MQFEAKTVEDLTAVSSKLIELTKSCQIVLLKANMGLGKTTLVKRICKDMGVDEPISSPTFSLVNEYVSSSGLIYHFDLYRIKDVEELYDIGIEEYLDSGYLCFIEWPELAFELMPEEHILVEIEMKENGRLFSLTQRK